MVNYLRNIRAGFLNDCQSFLVNLLTEFRRIFQILFTVFWHDCVPLQVPVCRDIVLHSGAQ